MQLSDVAKLDELRQTRGRARPDPGRRGRRAPGGRHGPRQRRGCPGVRGPVGRAVRIRNPPCRRPAHRQWPHPHPGPHRRRRGRRSARSSRSPICRSDQVVEESESSAPRSPRPPSSAPPSARAVARRQAASSARPCRLGRSPVAKAAVVGAVVTPGSPPVLDTPTNLTARSEGRPCRRPFRRLVSRFCGRDVTRSDVLWSRHPMLEPPRRRLARPGPRRGGAAPDRGFADVGGSGRGNQGVVRWRR